LDFFILQQELKKMPGQIDHGIQKLTNKATLKHPAANSTLLFYTYRNYENK